MGIGKGSFRRAVFGAFVGALLLALSVPGIALAATASFTAKVPASGSSSTNAKPTISVTVYDVRGIRYMSNILLSLDGHRVTPTVRFAAGYGFRKLTMSYAVPSNLSLGSHTVKVYVKDRSGQASRTSWSFTVTTSDGTAPVTTSNAVGDYATLAAILLFPTDSGSGVAHTYWKLDGGPVFEGTAASTIVLGPHSLEFWSVDNAGNVETHHTVTFTVASDLLSAWHQSDTVFCTRSGCHFASLTVEHAQHSVDFTCATCHSSTNAAVVAAIKTGSDDCMACHSNFTHIGTTDHHATVDPPTAVINCIQAGCHTGNLAAIHGPGEGCADCHENPAHAATNDCTVCHGNSGPHAGNHTAINGVVGAWAHDLGDPSCTASTCHGSDLMAPHITTANPTGCGTCHSAVAGSRFYAATIAAVATTGATCTTCHNPAHVAGANHNIAPACNCHGDGTPDNDASAIHMNQQATVGGVVITGCAICHANADHDLTLECAVCHAINAGHASLPTTVPPNGHPFAFFNHADPAGDPTADVNSTLCVGCHGDELPTVHIGAPACICHTASYLAAEMAPLLAAGTAECVDCHKGTHAAHSFGAIGSGHNTTTYGKKGVYTMFDGSQGVTLKDTEGATVTTDWDFPTANVFWSADSTQAPDTAMVGLTATSTITCQDCHTDLVADGPHGAAQSWGIDPNYDYPFKYAIVGGGAGANSATNYSLNTKAAGSSQTTGAATPATITAGIPASASGIKARIAANLGTVAVPIKSTNPADLMITNYQNYPDYQGAQYIADATSGQYAVICAKCHDLFNPVPLTTTQTDNGWSNAGPDSYEGMHGAHAGGTARNGGDIGRIDGRSDCAACHVAVPHAWRQPRLLVNGFTGNYYLGGGWSGGVLNPGTPTPSVADPFPYYQGRGMPFSTGVGAMAPAPAVSPGNGPNDAKDNHAFNAFGKPVWEEAACISCSGANTGTELEHKGLTTEPAKIK